jgi:hypothetical protein
MFEEVGPTEHVVGTYMLPWRLIGPEFDSLDVAVSVEHSADANGTEVLITRIGGLFARAPEHLTAAVLETVAEAFNLVLCELALAGADSAPVSSHDIETGKLNNGHAFVDHFSSRADASFDRTVGPLFAIRREIWMTWADRLADRLALQPSWTLRHAKRLAQVSTTMPRLIVGAYWNDTRGHEAESLIDCWIVVEQFLDRMWEDHLGSIPEALRRRQLRDQRTFSAAVRVELLRTVGRLPPELHEQVEVARAARNRLAHRADLPTVGAGLGMIAMRGMLEDFLGETVDLGREDWRANCDRGASHPTA